ncbi:MAG: AAA family ATPase, partial [Oscillospiraceae bacterium]|nr:AAA family ATPase [Oscillospiraceae bacterium]
TEKVRRKPYSVILLDEVEKAHPDVFNILLQMLEDGRLTDSKGRVVSFKNTIVVMTSNIGASTISNEKRLGFGRVDPAGLQRYEEMKSRVLAEVRTALRPEFLNRLDEVIVFHALSQAEIERIAALLLRQVSARLTERGMHLSVTEEAVALLAQAGFDPNYGARPLRRMIQRRVEDALSEEILSGDLRLGDDVEAYVEEEKLKFRRAELALWP